MRTCIAALACTFLSASAFSTTYPLDGYERTGIRRLLAIQLVEKGELSGSKQPEGALLSLSDVDLRLLDRPDLALPAPDPDFTRRVVEILGDEAESYGMAVLDLTDPENPHYAEHRGDHKQNVGSVGKLVVALALFQALADAWPDDLEKRAAVLRETLVTADDFSQADHHTVRFFDADTKKLTRRTIRIGDQASLYEYLDWMLSPSSNSAAGMVMREAMLLRQFAKAYPLTEEKIRAFFADTPKNELTALFERTFVAPMTQNGLDVDLLRQASIFTHEGKRIVPGPGSSYGSARELTRYLLLLEQGRIVDAFSSREIKRLIYVTERRIRYAAAPALAPSAVYFKSGSLYACKEEPGFECEPYAGNVRNYMNSAAIIEHPAGERKLYYMVTIISNVLRKNSASVHLEIATRLQKLVESMHAPQKPAVDGLLDGAASRPGVSRAH
ncbi:MAG TPA: serine hydrolase [Vicinamibacteria bacterium]|nr:serine hydrolase [Vicinamibacteria bacterium]